MIFSHLVVSKRLPIRLVMIAVTFVAPGWMPLWAQDQTSQAPDTQQMQKKLDELENEIRELKQQINNQQTNAQPTKSPQTNTQETNPPAQLPVPNGQLSEGNVPSPTDQETEQPEKVEKASTLDLYGFIMLDAGHDFGA